MFISHLQLPRLDPSPVRGRCPARSYPQACRRLIRCQVLSSQRASPKVPGSRSSRTLPAHPSPLPDLTPLLTTEFLQQSSSYVPVGRPVIQQSRPAAPPTPVGTNYETKKNELAEIRKTQESLVGPGAPAARPTPAPSTATPPAGLRTATAPAAAPQPPVIPSRAAEPETTPAPVQSAYERPAPVVSLGV